MGAYHGAQACEIVGLFLLSELVKLPNFDAILFRDDGLGITTSSTRQTGKLREAIIKVFQDHNLGIEIVTGQDKVNFLWICRKRSTNHTEMSIPEATFLLRC